MFGSSCSVAGENSSITLWESAVQEVLALLQYSGMRENLGNVYTIEQQREDDKISYKSPQSTAAKKVRQIITVDRFDAKI